MLVNPDVYTLWNYRREIILSRKNDVNTENIEEEENKTSSEVKSLTFQNLVNNELELTVACLKQNPKSYNAWHQRCWLIENSPEPDYKNEIQLCDKFLNFDERNC